MIVSDLTQSYADVYAHGSVFQVSDGADMFVPEQFEAPDVNAPEDCNWLVGF